MHQPTPEQPLRFAVRPMGGHPVTWKVWDRQLNRWHPGKPHTNKLRALRKASDLNSLHKLRVMKGDHRTRLQKLHFIRDDIPEVTSD